MKNPPVIRTMFGFEQAHFSHTMVWDMNGNYVGQFQPNMLDDYPGAPDELFIRSTVGLDTALMDLTGRQMKGAENYPIFWG